jgi:hypothetical protein
MLRRKWSRPLEVFETVNPSCAAEHVELQCSHSKTQSFILMLLLFSWRYNPLWLYFHSPVAGFSLLVFEVS